MADRARLIAEDHGIDLDLVHVVEPLSEAMIDKSIAKMVGKFQTEEAESLAAWVRDRSSMQVKLDVVKGSPAWELVSRSKSADLVVLGSSSIDAFTAGPVTKRVSEMAASDVLVVRRQPRIPYRRIVVTTDFSESSRTAVAKSMELFPNADITVLYSLPSRFDPVMADAGLFREEVAASRRSRLDAAADRMEEFTRPWSGSIRTLIADGPPTETVDEAVRRHNADLVMVANRGATATRMVLLGTVAEGLVERAPCDVFVTRTASAFRRP